MHYKELNLRTANDQARATILLLPTLDRDVHLLSTFKNLLVGKRRDAELLQRIVRVGDEFTQEDIPV